MARPSPRPLSPAEQSQRLARIQAIADEMGFVGRVRYVHAYSRTGGAQYGQASEANLDLLTVYAEAFDRDADPEDYSLEALIAHERGHQLFVRHPRLSKSIWVKVSEVNEEIVASLLGAILCGEGPDGRALAAKAVGELLAHGMDQSGVKRLTQNLIDELEAFL